TQIIGDLTSAPQTRSMARMDPQNTDDDVTDAAFDVKEIENVVHVSANGSDKTDKEKHDEKAKRDDKGKSLVDSLTGVRDLRAEFEEFSFNSTNRVNAVSAPANAAGPNPTNNTKSFNTTGPSVNAVSLNFGIARKSSFVDPSKYPDDPDMPELEDIVYSDDEEDVGAKADLSNLETNIPVSPILTTRVQKDHPVNQIIGFMIYQMDIKSDFLYETIEEEVYVCQPLRFKDLNYPDKVYKVVKALYGLHQAPRAWYETLANYLLENGFQRRKTDQTLFIKKQKGDILLVQVYVDDIIFGSTNKELCKAFDKLMKDKFQMSSIGKLTFFLGLQVKKKDDGIFISQDKYIGEILSKFGFTYVKSASTPIKTEKPLHKDPDGKDVDVHIYRSIIGSLMYLISSRLDIMFAVCACARFQVTLKESHLHAGVNTPRCDEDSIELKELMVFMYQFDEKDGIGVTTVKNVNADVQLHALIDGKKVVVLEVIIRTDLHLDDDDWVECAKRIAWNEFCCSMASVVICLAIGRNFNFSKYIFDSMVRNVDSPSKFLMYPRFLQVVMDHQVDDMTTHNTRSTSPALTQKVAPAPPSTTSAPSPPDLQNPTPTPPHTPHDTPLQDQPLTPHDSPPHDQLTTPYESYMPLLTTLMETYATLSQKVVELEKDKHSQALEILQLKKRVKKLEKKKKSKSSGFKRLRRVGGKITAIDADDSITLVDVEIDEEKLHDEEVQKATARDKQEKADIEGALELQRQKYQNLKKKPISIAQAKKNMIICLKNMAGYKMELFIGMNYDKVRPIFERKYKKVQTLFKLDKDVHETKTKRVADETLLQESFKKLRAAKVSGSESTQEIPSNDPKEMTKEDVQNLLEIFPVPEEFKVKALQVKYPIIDWEIHTEDILKGFDREDLVALWNLVKEKFSLAVPSEDKEKALWVELKRLFEPDADDVLWKLQRYTHAPLTWKLYVECGVHHVSSTRGHDIFMLTEKDYPLSKAVMILMLSGKLQVEEVNEMARDLVMKIFTKANKPRSRSLDTSS
nr:copia protein [Tanacetum cinerariifolium]